jgi:replicative DNA helicase
LDKILNGGFKSPDLIILGGRPSMGKTQFSTFFAEEAAKLGKHVYFVSIEMTAMQLVARMAAREGISYSNMRQGRLTSSEWSMIDSRASELQQLRINIADSPDCRQLSYIKSEARLLKRKGELDIMFVDYLGLIKTNMRFEKRYIEVGYITGELKALAKELQIPIILLAQLSRPPQGREKETPKMEALRESGDIEQDADIIIFPHRPYVYDSTAVDEMGRSWKDRGVLLIEKNREGQRNVKVYFENDPQFKNFWDDEQANERLDNTTA